MRPGDIKGYYGEEVFIPQFKINKMNLSITPEKVKEAADKCPQAKETLKTLFPEVFKDKTRVEIDKTMICDKADSWVLEVIKHGDVSAIRLSGGFKWEFTKGEYGNHILIPRRI